MKKELEKRLKKEYGNDMSARAAVSWNHVWEKMGFDFMGKIIYRWKMNPLKRERTMWWGIYKNNFLQMRFPYSATVDWIMERLAEVDNRSYGGFEAMVDKMERCQEDKKEEEEEQLYQDTVRDIRRDNYLKNPVSFTYK